MYLNGEISEIILKLTLITLQLTHTNTPVPSTKINPIALRKAKIVYNFGLSECN